MSRLDQAEARRLLSYLRNRITDIETLAHIEDELRGDYAEEFLREPELLAWFPPLQEEFEPAKPREATVTLQFDVDLVNDEGGQAHAVTEFIGRGHSGVETEIELL